SSLEDENHWLIIRRIMAEHFEANRAIYMSVEWDSFRPRKSSSLISAQSGRSYTFEELYELLYGCFKRNPHSRANINSWFDTIFHGPLAADALSSIIAILPSPNSTFITLYLPRDYSVVRSKENQKLDDIRTLRDLRVPLLGMVYIPHGHF